MKSAVVVGLQEVSQAIELLKQQHGEKWWQKFAEFYVTEKRTCEPNQSCGLQSLTSEVSRSDEEMKSAYEKELVKIAQQASEEGDDAVSDDTWAKLAILVGGVTMARAVNDPELSEQIGLAIKNSALFK